jgi:hypothetical protein
MANLEPRARGPIFYKRRYAKSAFVSAEYKSRVEKFKN